MLRPPSPPTPVRRRRSFIVPEFLLICGVLFILVVLLIRDILAILGTEPWIVSWQVTYFISYPLVRPLQVVDLFNNETIGSLTVAEIVATVIAAGVALYAVASLAVRGDR